MSSEINDTFKPYTQPSLPPQGSLASTSIPQENLESGVRIGKAKLLSNIACQMSSYFYPIAPPKYTNAFKTALNHSAVKLFDSLQAALELSFAESSLILCYSVQDEKFGAMSSKDLEQDSYYEFISQNDLAEIVSLLIKHPDITDKQQVKLNDLMFCMQNNNNFNFLNFKDKNVFENFENAVKIALEKDHVLVFNTKNKTFLAANTKEAERNQHYQVLSKSDFVGIVCNFEVKLEQVSSWQLHDLRNKQNFLYGSLEESSTSHKVQKTLEHTFSGQANQIAQGALIFKKMEKIELSMGRLTFEKLRETFKFLERLKNIFKKLEMFLHELEKVSDYQSIIQITDGHSLGIDEIQSVLRKINELNNFVLTNKQLVVELAFASSIYQGKIQEFDKIKGFFDSFKEKVVASIESTIANFAFKTHKYDLTGKAAIGTFLKVYNQYAELEGKLRKLKINTDN